MGSSLDTRAEEGWCSACGLAGQHEVAVNRDEQARHRARCDAREERCSARRSLCGLSHRPWSRTRLQQRDARQPKPPIGRLTRRARVRGIVCADSISAARLEPGRDRTATRFIMRVAGIDDARAAAGVSSNKPRDNSPSRATRPRPRRLIGGSRRNAIPKLNCAAIGLGDAPGGRATWIPETPERAQIDARAQVCGSTRGICRGKPPPVIAQRLMPLVSRIAADMRAVEARGVSSARPRCVGRKRRGASKPVRSCTT